MAVQGLVRLRKHQFARQSAMGVKASAVRAYPFKGVPNVDLQWTDPDIDSGSIDPVAAPTRGSGDFTAPLNAPVVYYNDLPIIWSGFFGANVTPSTSGTSKTWLFEPQSDAPDTIDSYTYEFGDEVVSDWFQLGNGILESFELSGPEGNGACSSSMGWRFGSAASSGSTDDYDSPVVPTAGLNVDIDGTVLYQKDMGIYIASSTAGLSGGQIMDALHSFTLRGSQEIDQKRYANLTQNFDIDDYGRGLRAIELEAVWAKTADTVGIGSEADAWMSDDAVNRWVQLKFISKVEASAGIPYAQTITMPMRYYTRADTEVGGNTTVTLTGHAFFDPDDLDGAFVAEVVNTLDAGDL